MKSQEIRHALTRIALLNFVVLTPGIVGAVGVKKLFGLGLTADKLKEIREVPGLFAGGHPAFLSLAAASIALITFFGILRLGESAALPSDGLIRRAITIGGVTGYLVLVSTTTFYVPWADEILHLTRSSR